MEANRKRRGFVKGKLMPFHGSATKPSSTVQYISSKVKLNQSSPSTADPLGFLCKYENLYGSLAADESVDTKAATYISSVRERFKLERMNSERKKSQDMQLSA
ncbi:hypothetical protein I3842_04G038700 [Carya illinoinensis]|uniref:Uncharacterized protein n=1 Tax=Carya illinoinensis TaxID=32201 RepID=A0A922FAC2_CARIL|nr:hypothetical protein I3842_04G038700 [Carya illinoinensis]